MATTTRIELFKENFKFSSGHFTIFSQTERENIHGHNFTVHLAFDAEIENNGMIFDYGLVKRHMESKCKSLNEFFLLPANSPYLKIEETADYTYAHFNKEKIPFLKRDVKILPLRNITVEELARYFLEDFVDEFVNRRGHPIPYAEVRVFSGPGQCANAVWRKKG